jgi:hypothetical protein
VLGIGLEVGADDRLPQPAADVVLAARATRAEQVETDTGDDRRQPRAQILDRGALLTAVSIRVFTRAALR